jgi:predicted nucleic acid-binding protein
VRRIPLANIFWDSNLFIYLFEAHPKFGDPVRNLRRKMRARGDRLFTSCLTVGEILVKPASQNQQAVVERYTGFFSRPGITVLPFDLRAASLYALIRKDRRIGRADAMQLATAAASGIDLFITNDVRLSQAHVPGIDFISSLEKAPL